MNNIYRKGLKILLIGFFFRQVDLYIIFAFVNLYRPKKFKDNLRTIEARFQKNLRTTEAHFEFTGPYKKKKV